LWFLEIGRLIFFPCCFKYTYLGSILATAAY
jgi:hypothetical protein